MITSTPLTLERVRAAAERARPFVRRTPVQPLDGARNRWLKLDNLQPTGSFKVRGYAAAALALPEERRRAGLLTVSAGNAAAACAYVAHLLGVPCTVVMFDTAPPPKVAAVERWGGRREPMDRETLFRWMAEAGWERSPQAMLHPHLDTELAAGHGGVALEVLEQVPEVERVLVPVGGGGLATGVAAALHGARPEIEVVGVLSSGYPMWEEALRRGEPVAMTPQTIADGVAAPCNQVMLDRLAAAIDRWLVVPEERLRESIPELAQRGRVVAEGAGALAYAALDQVDDDRPTVALVTGGNLDPALLRELLAT
ncbi:MAG: pyridoxal-phosphate dependent enzyme [Candidatus Dormibacteraeota bacterium]|nr:pyridoxal-phosphate dependent enzyme [Candidatus Dormibacteraeota bacterium]